MPNSGVRYEYWQIMGVRLYFSTGMSGVAIQKCSIPITMKAWITFCETGFLWEHWSQVHLIALETELLLLICVPFLQKWNSQLIIPASSTNKNNLEEDREKRRVDLYSTNESFPVEQLQTFSQLLQNIHRLEVSFRKISVSSLNVLRDQRMFLYAHICE